MLGVNYKKFKEIVDNLEDETNETPTDNVEEEVIC